VPFFWRHPVSLTRLTKEASQLSLQPRLAALEQLGSIGGKSIKGLHCLIDVSPHRRRRSVRIEGREGFDDRAVLAQGIGIASRIGQKHPPCPLEGRANGLHDLGGPLMTKVAQENGMESEVELVEFRRVVFVGGQRLITHHVLKRCQ
jgi:hypothetical protein